MTDATQPYVHMVSDEEAHEQAKQIFAGMVQQQGSVPKWMRVMANCEDVFVGFFSMFKSTMDNDPVSALLKWKIAHIVSEHNKCKYCVDVTSSKLKGLGLPEEDLDKVEAIANESEKLAIEFARAATDCDFKRTSELMPELKKHFNDQQVVEITAAIGLFNYINRFNDALNVLPDA